MIQRIQTIFLFLVVLSMGLMTFLMPLWAVGLPDGSKAAKLWAYEFILKEGETLKDLANPLPILILAALASIVAIVSISQFKNRLLQMKLGMLNSILIGGTLVAAVIYINIGTAEFGPGELIGGYRTGFFMPIVALLGNFMANRFIRRDERMVKDSDRLR